MLMTSFSHKKCLLQLQCPLFNPTSILCHCGLPLVISPSTPKKTKYMIVSRKPPSFLTSLSPLFENCSQLERVNSFKYLGIIFTSNLSWSPHIQSVHSKKLVKPLGPSTVTSISMLLLILFSLCITFLSFPIFPIVCLFGTYLYLPLMLKFSRKPNTLL